MNSREHFIREVKWTGTEKKVARKAYDKAFERQCTAIATEAKRMLENITDPSEVWQVEAYLRDHRKIADRVYHYSYSDLLQVFSILMRDGWLKEADLHGIQPEKVVEIKEGAQSLLKIFRD
jgi:hypothetical protein